MVRTPDVRGWPIL
uniref:Uncharacterized protein n=1 Tax=Arundo donax TaxID=35708 RepID=A0A0A8XZD3_ARUDO